MEFDLQKSIEILERTPIVLTALLSGLSDTWTKQNEGENTWSPYDVVGHLLHGEKTDWIPRLKIILEHGPSKPFEPYDRFAQFRDSHGKPIEQLLEEFTRLRKENLHILKSLQLDAGALSLKGSHPALGEVTLQQLLATWAAHDLSHIVQISRVMAKLCKEQVGPWKAYFSLLKD